MGTAIARRGPAARWGRMSEEVPRDMPGRRRACQATSQGAAMGAETKQARRRRLIAQAHLAAKMAGCSDEDDRRAVQLAVTGKASCSEMNERELVAIIDHWGRMGAGVCASTPEATGAAGMASRWQLATIERLAWDLGWDGLEDDRLLRFVRRTAKVDAVRWLTREQASSVISGLMRWRRQIRSKGGRG